MLEIKFKQLLIKIITNTTHKNTIIFLLLFGKYNLIVMAENKKISIGIKILIGVWLLFIIGIVAIFLLFKSINDGKIGYLPPIEELQNPKNKFASEI